MVFDRYATCGGVHSESAAVHNVLANAGVTAPHTGRPFSEAFLLGLGGGLGAGYFVFQFGDVSTLYVGTRCLWYEWNEAFQRRMVERVGGSLHASKTTGSQTARKKLLKKLQDDRPVSVWVDMGGLPYWGYKRQQYIPHVVTVCGYQESTDVVDIDDLAPTPWSMTLDELSQARSAIRSLKHCATVLDPPDDVGDLTVSVRDAIQDCIRDMRNPRMKNFGLTALEKWRNLIANPRNKKGWPLVFPPGPNLYRALFYTYHWIETAGTGGGGFRPMYGDFLAEASHILGNRRLAELSKTYAQLGAEWSRLAKLALPDGVEPLGMTRELLQKRCDLLQTQGPAEGPEIARLTRELHCMEESVAQEFPLDGQEALSLLEQMQAQLDVIYTGEKDALEQLEDAMT
jgi:hypothetical protein